MKPRVHYLGLWGKNRKLRCLNGGYNSTTSELFGEIWQITGSANVEEARRRVVRVKAGATDDPGVRRLK